MDDSGIPVRALAAAFGVEAAKKGNFTTGQLAAICLAILNDGEPLKLPSQTPPRRDGLAPPRRSLSAKTIGSSSSSSVQIIETSRGTSQSGGAQSSRRAQTKYGDRQLTYAYTSHKTVQVNNLEIFIFSNFFKLGLILLGDRDYKDHYIQYIRDNYQAIECGSENNACGYFSICTALFGKEYIRNPKMMQKKRALLCEFIKENFSGISSPKDRTKATDECVRPTEQISEHVYAAAADFWGVIIIILVNGERLEVKKPVVGVPVDVIFIEAQLVRSTGSQVESFGHNRAMLPKPDKCKEIPEKLAFFADILAQA